MILAQTVTKNSLFSLSSSVVQKLLTLGYFIIVARVFGPEDQGRYSAAIAFATLFSVLIDLGLSSALTRETARTPERAPIFLGQMFLTRIVLGVLVYVLIVWLALALGYSSELVSLIRISALAAVIDTVTSSCWFLLRGFRNLLYESIASIAAIIAMIMFGGIAVLLKLPVMMLVIAVLMGSIVNLCVALATVFWKARMPLLLKPDFVILKYLALVSLPFAAAAICSRISTFVDVVILAKIAGETAVGWYAAGNKLIMALYVFPGALSASIYPVLSAYGALATERLAALTSKALFVVILIAAPLGTGLAVVAPDIVMVFYGEAYNPTVPVLQLLSLSIICGYATFPLGALLAAMNRQKANAIAFFLAAVVNIFANIFFIPRFGAFGAALASALSVSALLLYSLFAARAIMVECARTLTSQMMRIFLCACGMAAVLIALRSAGAGLGILLFAGVVSYVIFVVLTRTITLKEVVEIVAPLVKEH